jgi:asparagine synthase (glutamine-hydrolysing)
MDSGAVVASPSPVLRRQRGHADDLEVTTMVLGAGSGDGEGAYAEEVRTHLGLVGTLFSGAEATVLDPLGEPVLRLAEPQQIERTDFRLRMTRHAAARAPVTLTGLGGDALLGFATTWWVAGLRAGRVASTTRALLERPLLGLGRPRPHVRAVAGVLWAGHPTPGPPGWLAAGCRERAAVHARRDRLGRLEGFDVADLYRSPFWSDLARRGHPSVSKRPMQHRHPLYDLRLIRLMGTIAPEVWTPGKRLLRDATGDRLPERVRRRPKRPLVRATLPGDTPAAQGRLAELVLAAPDLDRYVDRSALAAACRPGATEDPGTSTTIDRALGLAHWLAHR